jgi:hypothetical protein
MGPRLRGVDRRAFPIIQAADRVWKGITQLPLRHPPDERVIADADPQSVFSHNGICPIELPVQASLYDTLSLTDADMRKGGRQQYGRGGERARAKVIIIVFDEAGEILRKRIFPTDADSPATPRLVAGGVWQARRRGELKIMSRSQAPPPFT